MRAHRNNVGLLRLVLAAFVIIAHAPEMADNNDLREPLNQLLHAHLSLGDLAVDGFFLLSGYLIAQSMEQARSLRDYLTRRVLRIYPAFVVAYLLSVFVFGPVVGAHPWGYLPQTFGRMILLLPTMYYPGQLAGQRPNFLNGSLWTIAYEFRCYILIGVLGVTGLLARRRLILAITVLAVLGALAAAFAQPVVIAWDMRHPQLSIAIGNPWSTLRLTAIFLVGTCFYLYRETVFPALSGRVALACAAAAVALMYRDRFVSEAAMTTLGAAALFWLAFKARLGWLQRINDSYDISYGVYLYGWPAEAGLRWAFPTLGPWAVAPLALVLAAALGAASWWGLERWAKGWGRSRGGPSQTTPAAVSSGS